MTVLKQQLEILRNDFLAAIDRCRPRQLRSLSQFALDEIIIPPGGPHAGERFSFEFQPFVRLLYEVIESGRFPRHAVTGPPQTGKTFNVLVVPLMFHLFEIEENVVYAIPTMVMAFDKWERDILPAIQASRYAHLLPEDGQGSKGGKFESITFKNGATLKFMSAKGGDEKRSGYTARVVMMTEIDKYDEPSESSKESDPVTQILERLGAFEALKTLIYMECTVSSETGRIWVEYTNGSMARIAMQCVHCLHYVTLEREHLIGWQDADDEITAREQSHFACPNCGGAWTEGDRREANRTAKLVHKGQSITPDGTIHGPMPRTLTSGFRWNSANNLFKPAADFGGREWAGRLAPNEKNSERALRQSLWAMPAVEATTDQTPLDVVKLLERTHAEGRGVVPEECRLMSIGLDLGGWWCHWTAYAWGPRARGYIIDYGRIGVPQASLGLEAGLMEAMRQFRDLCNGGWKKANGETIFPDENLIDSGWQTPLAYQFIRETGLPFRPCKGLSVSGEPVSYNRPKSTGAIVQFIGDGWHLAALKDDDIYLVEIDANAAKSTLHSRLNCDLTAPGAITMFKIDRTDLKSNEERRQFVRQLTAEKSVTQFVPGRGTITQWQKIRAANHSLDSSALGLVGGTINGVSVIDQMEETADSASTLLVGASVPRPTAQPAPEVSHEVPTGIVRPVRSGWVRRQRR